MSCSLLRCSRVENEACSFCTTVLDSRLRAVLPCCTDDRWSTRIPFEAAMRNLYQPGFLGNSMHTSINIPPMAPRRNLKGRQKQKGVRGTASRTSKGCEASSGEQYVVRGHHQNGSWLSGFWLARTTLPLMGKPSRDDQESFKSQVCY